MGAGEQKGRGECPDREKKEEETRDNEWAHKQPRSTWSLTAGFPQPQGEERVQSSGHTDREPALRTILTGFLLSPPRAPAELW